MRSPAGLRQSRKVTSPPSSSFANDWLPCKDSMDIKAYPWLVHQVRGWYSGAAAYFGWMREAKRENTCCGLRPKSDKAAGRKTRGPEGCDENRPRLRCSSVTYRFRYAPLSRLAGGRF